MDCSGLLELQERAGGVIIPVKAKPAARKNGITGFFNGLLKVSVTTAPENGKANKSILKVLAKELKIPPKLLSLYSGSTSSEKKILVLSTSLTDLHKKISSLKL